MRDQHDSGGRPEIDDTVNPTSAAPDDWGREPAPDRDRARRSNDDWGREPDADDREGGHSGQSGQGWRGWSTADAAGGAQQFLSQLQAMIDNLATQSAPVVREIGAKAAELAAVAAERAGPLAQRAAVKTQEVGARVAERSREFAEDMRRQAEGRAGSDGGPTDRDNDTTAPTGPTV